MSTTIRTIHQYNQFGGHRIRHRTTDPLFNLGTLQWVTAQAAHYATVEGPDAMRFAIGLAGLDHSRHAAA